MSKPKKKIIKATRKKQKHYLLQNKDSPPETTKVRGQKNILKMLKKKDQVRQESQYTNILQKFKGKLNI